MDDSEFELFHEIAARICSSLHLEIAMSRTLIYISDFIPIDEMYMALFDNKKKVFRLIARASRTDGIIMNHEITSPPSYLHEVERFDRKKSPLIVNSPKNNPLISSLFPQPKMRNSSVLILPLTVDENLIGVSMMFAYGSNVYTPQHANLLSKVTKPFSIALSNSLEHLELETLKQDLVKENIYLRRKINENSSTEFIGKKTGLKNVFEMIHKVAPLSSTVLVLGETGTGKELVANAIHTASNRQNGPFVKLNCGAIPESLVDSELFGHEKGSFTGAHTKKLGRFERANNGTLFLDEIGELPIDMQVRLLRVIQEKEIERVGAEKSIPVNVRIICATQRDLTAMAAEGKFRQDLLFRINVFPIVLPPLRKRKEDIPLLVHHFIEKKSAEFGLRTLPKVRPEDMQNLMEYSWPGNVRELQNIVERSIILSRSGTLVFDHILPALCEKSSLQEIEPVVKLDDSMRMHIVNALHQTKGRVSGPNGAAVLLGINSSTLRNRMKKLGIND
ncbi:sigma-54-dependent Fis family transcriptional regulator [Dehalobacter restrictus]|uniref:Fis family transcriptional regulator n=1 Tax=Dehalobacter restrictus (strain DSM 9455 / PER-K23) TaxID=871738 RepID=A0ABM5P744_DEHRP|nr:sigma 54-interacting transcriptional regulator [Dehalobacter restrictus]AHF10466.1 Fis family transcriptional regulator [Dehalobacter restrictus DSM 9455]